MTESESLLTYSAFVLLTAWAYHHPEVSRWLGPRGLYLILLGGAFPLVESLGVSLFSGDRIAFLVYVPLFHGIFFGVLVLAFISTLVGAWTGWLVGLRSFFVMGLGYLLMLLLALMTPSGVHLATPFSEFRYSLPFFPVGHPLLIALLVLILLALEGFRAWRRGFFGLGVALVLFYFLAGPLQYGLIRFQAGAEAGPNGIISVSPVGGFFSKWLVVLEEGGSYRFRRARIDLMAATPWVSVPRWNNEALTARMLGNPVINRFYFHIFSQPVLQVDQTGSQITLIMKELENQRPEVPGRRFYFETDINGRNRLYEVNRFN